MSPARQFDGPLQRSQISRQTAIVPTLQTKRNVIRATAAKRRPDSDPRAFLATIGEAGNLCFAKENK